MVIIGGKISKPNEDSGRATRRFQKGIFQKQACCHSISVLCILHTVCSILYDLKIALCQIQIHDISPCSIG